ncbi:Fe-S cluster assembly protein SufB [Peptoniphilus koenoeneniae]|uniref:Fe-S cluster assembly protein SufB n=1 Tax=Peptoniphilus koenoeneniae TaxID=507751 RepID=A0ABU0ARW4_9FIRM|nr:MULTISPECIES: Fe-S cluster assembly protein SufB [Peptoniphilus]ERT62214.1 FeS assembly protein SufB [Peptoniphilus sp. BV3C26]MDQ0274016.1 Fe-S cluster assembly protein SufB [Peptoniphilus koenoeneniae]
MVNKKKTEIDEMDRGIYDIKNKFEYRSKTEKGISEEIVRQISKEKNEPDWMLEKRLEALKIFNQKSNPSWGPDISEVDMDKVTTYIRPKADMSDDWKEVPEDIRNTFDKLGIPEAEKESLLSGVGAQYDSEVVYHSIQKHLLEQGVIYTDFESAVKKYPKIIKEYFGTCIRPTLHKYAALHYAVWSGGSFVYVPKGVKVDIPLQSYFRLNAPGAGQFEHTLIIIEEDSYCHFIEGCSAPKYNVLNLHAGAVELFVKKNATLRYSTIENWSRNMYNLNTKRAIVEENGLIQWISGSFGSKVSMLYPCSVLKGERASSEYTGISFAGPGQNIDTGAQAIHLAPHTTSTVNSKSISKGGGIAVYRGLVKISEKAKDSKSSVSCESLMLDSKSRSDTIPVIDIKTKNVDFGHEAKIGRISDEVIFYLMSRGISELEAKSMVVRGFAEPVAKELPMEYAVEMNNLINLELEGAIG